MRWILLAPGTLLLAVIGSVAGGLAGVPFGEGAANTGSAFGGAFFFVLGACLVAPSRRRAVGVGAALLVTIAAGATAVFSSLPQAESLVRQTSRDAVVSPVALILGALYALYFLRQGTA